MESIYDQMAGRPPIAMTSKVFTDSSQSILSLVYKLTKKIVHPAGDTKVIIDCDRSI